MGSTSGLGSSVPTQFPVPGPSIIGGAKPRISLFEAGTAPTNYQVPNDSDMLGGWP